MHGEELTDVYASQLPQYLLRKGRNVLKFYDVRSQQSAGRGVNNEFVLKTAEQFAEETSSDVRSAKKYFKYSKLKDLVYAYPFRENATPGEWIYEQEQRRAFLDFLNGLLAADPTARWTAREALQHPFITGDRFLPDVPPLYDMPGDCRGPHLVRHTDAASYYYQQPPQQTPQNYTSALQMDTVYHHHHPQQPLPPPPAPPQPQRVCPINAYYYGASSYPYYTGAAMSVYAYGQPPWTPMYSSAAYAPTLDGNYLYGSVHQPFTVQSQEQQPQFYNHETLYEVRSHIAVTLVSVYFGRTK